MDNQDRTTLRSTVYEGERWLNLGDLFTLLRKQGHQFTGLIAALEDYEGACDADLAAGRVGRNRFHALPGGNDPADEDGSAARPDIRLLTVSEDPDRRQPPAPAPPA